MKDEYVIAKLKLLKKVEPGAGAVLDVKRRIDSEIKPGENISVIFQKPMPFVFYGAATLTFAILVLFITGILPNGFGQAVLYSRIVLAQNQYEKADLTLSYTKGKIDGLVSKGKISSSSALGISKTLAYANDELSGLKLMGEKDKYSSSQCKELYKSYDVYLWKLDNYLARAGLNPEINLLRSQIRAYEKESARKLNLYNPL